MPGQVSLHHSKDGRGRCTREAAEREAKGRQGRVVGVSRNFHLKGLCVCVNVGAFVFEVRFIEPQSWPRGHDQTRACTWVTTPPLPPNMKSTILQLNHNYCTNCSFVCGQQLLWRGSESWPCVSAGRVDRSPPPVKWGRTLHMAFKWRRFAVVFGTGRCGLTQARRRCQLSLPASPPWSKSGEGEGWNKDVN